MMQAPERQNEFMSIFICSQKSFKLSNYINNEPMIRSLYDDKIRLLQACMSFEEKFLYLTETRRQKEKR
jgi:hypothetical protein